MGENTALRIGLVCLVGVRVFFSFGRFPVDETLSWENRNRSRGQEPPSNLRQRRWAPA